jgi:hypothetical protein
MARERGAAAERIWRARLARQRRSGQTVAEFCEHEGVSTPAFYAWKRRLTGATTDHGGAVKRSVPLFVPLSLSPVVSGVRIVLPGGAVVELPPSADERLLRTCIRAAAERDPDGEEHAC